MLGECSITFSSGDITSASEKSHLEIDSFTSQRLLLNGASLFKDFSEKTRLFYVSRGLYLNGHCTKESSIPNDVFFRINDVVNQDSTLQRVLLDNYLMLYKETILGKLIAKPCKLLRFSSFHPPPPLDVVIILLIKAD